MNGDFQLQQPSHIPDWVTFPEDDWAENSPEDAGLDPDGFRRFLGGLDVREAAFGGEDHSNGRWGAVLTRGGYLLKSWGDRHYRAQTASVGKAFAWAAFGLAVEDGLVDPDAPIHETWTGEGELSHPHKLMNAGHHGKLTWRHLLGPREKSEHYGGFAIELGIRWSEKRHGLEDADAAPGVPEWAKWTGDPFYDCYSHVEPGTQAIYSSAGYWRLGQALTALWVRDLKDVLDERLFGEIGVPADRWQWPAGGWIKDQKYLYPTIPDAYTYLDPPYEIGGHAVRSAPGWVVMSASDLARFGHLVATGGIWKGKRVLGAEWLRGHSGGNKSGASGEGRHYTAMGVVTTLGLDHAHSTETESFIPKQFFTGPPRL